MDIGERADAATARVAPTRAAERVAAAAGALHAGERLVMRVDSGCCEPGGVLLQRRWWDDPGEATLGEVGGLPVVCSRAEARRLAGIVLAIDAVPAGQGVDSFSLESELGCRFRVTRLLEAPGRRTQA